MINILDKSSCCGCQACGDVCPREAIAFLSDDEGFWYPKVDVSKCVNCGLCDRVCPELHLNVAKSFGQHEPIVYGGYHKNIAVRFDSTSGGAFSALASAMYKQGGYVAGAVQSADDWSVTNYISNNKRDLVKLRSSKYVQSAAQGLYKRIAELLASGEKVLACGSPCQMAALRTYLAAQSKVPTTNLVIVDFICRATNSPKVYARYLDWLEKVHGSHIVSIKAKNKDHGWRSLARKILFANGDVYYGEGEDDPFRRGYHWNYYQRPSCYECKFKGFPRVADITLGDFWGIDKVDRSLDHNLGTSCILINTEIGARYFELAKVNLVLKEFPLECVLNGGNRVPLEGKIARPEYDRSAMFADIGRLPFDLVAEKYFPREKVCGPTELTAKRRLRLWVRFFKRCLYDPMKCYRLAKWSLLHRRIDADFIEGRVFDVRRYCAIDIRSTGKIIIGRGHFSVGTNKNVQSKLETRLLVEAGARLDIAGNGYLGAGADIQLFPNSHVKIGMGDCFNCGLEIVCAESIEFGPDVHVGRDVKIRDNNGEHFIIQSGYNWKAPVKIGAHCWIGSNVSILKGVTIGEGTVVSANSVVSQSLPARCIAAGNPAVVVAEDIIWRA